MTARELAIVAFDAAPPLYERMTAKHGRLSGVSGANLEHIAGSRAGLRQYSTPHENFQPSGKGILNYSSCACSRTVLNFGLIENYGWCLAPAGRGLSSEVSQR